MGWRDINMSRRKPPLRLAVVPLEDGQDHGEAVLHKSCRAAKDCLAAQLGGSVTGTLPAFRCFAAGYLAGFARHQALKHGVDAEEGEDIPLHRLLPILQLHAPAAVAEVVAGLRFHLRNSPRTSLRAEDAMADAGYLVGHLESLCGSQRLLKAAAGVDGSEQGVEAFLTACDTAADRLQTHQPTMSLRLDLAERASLRAAFSPSA